jgi:ABC-2 type transport system permease protein
MRRLGLIAGREFKAYVATLTFWAALVIGPLLTLGAAGVMSQAREAPEPLRVALSSPDPELRAASARALEVAADAIGRPLALDSAGPTRLQVRNTASGPHADFDGAPLPPPARAVFVADLERRLTLDLAARAGAPADALGRRVTVRQAEAQLSRAGAETFARFILVFILWLTLAGSLGMLLQAVARERANRALDILLSAARPGEIVFGKLLGVGAVSLLVLGAWMGSAAALALAAGPAAGPLGVVLAALAKPALLAQALVAYGLAYAIYGSVTIALGAAAGDVASAQNLSRPMFGVLLIAFFTALSSAMGARDALDWAIWIPPLTPFMWLLDSPRAPSFWGEAAPILLMAVTALVACVLARAALHTPHLHQRRSIPRASQPEVGIKMINKGN